MISTITQDKIYHFVGLSSDIKPIVYMGVEVGNGSLFEEIDTSIKYIYDKEHQQWIDQTTHQPSQAADISYNHNINIHATSNITVNSFQVPNLTQEQVTTAYNTVVAGNNCVISDATDTYHMCVNQADSLNGLLTIELLYFSTMLLIYTINENDEVEISYKDI